MSGLQAGRLRRAGRLDLGKGASALWSVAEGRRGRRWRSLRLGPDGSPVCDLLLELDTDGGWTRLEMANANGILALHPEPDGHAYGNVVTPTGMRHLAVEWGSGRRLVVAGEPVAALALAAANPSGAGPGLLVAEDLTVRTVLDLAAPDVPAALPEPAWPLEEEGPPERPPAE